MCITFILFFFPSGLSAGEWLQRIDSRSNRMRVIDDALATKVMHCLVHCRPTLADSSHWAPGQLELG